MSLSNRFQHPFERWMNQMWKREMDQFRRPPGSKIAKHMPKSLQRGSHGDWNKPSQMMSREWMEPYRDMWDDSFGSEMMNLMPQRMMMQTETTTNDNGDHVVKAKMPFGVAQDDIHLNFEDGGLKLSATKTHEEEKKHLGSKHKSYVSVSHYWPLAEDVKPEDIEAHFDADGCLLEITIPQSKLAPRAKSMPITIGGAVMSKGHEMLDQAKSAAEIVQEKGAEMAEKAKDAVASGMETLKETGQSAMKMGAKGRSTIPFSGEAKKDEAKSFEAKKDESKKDEKTKNPMDAPQVPSIDEM